MITKQREGSMFVIRFRVQCQPDKAAELRSALKSVVAPSRATAGVISFDIAEDLVVPNVFIATEIFEDDSARTRQESLPEVAAVFGLLPNALAAPPQATIYHVSAHEPAM